MPPVSIRSDRVSDAKLIEQIRQFEEDANFLALHHHSLLDNYPEQWVAVYNKTVMAHGTNINAVRRELTAKGVPPDRVAITFLTRKQQTLIL